MMKMKLYILLLFSSILFNACGDPVPLEDLIGKGDKKPTTDLKYQIDGKKDDDTSNKTNNRIIHHQGQPCLICHQFAIAGTVYNKDNRPAVFNSIRLIGENGSLFEFFQGLGDGNFYIHHFNEKKFTVKVIDQRGTIVNSSKVNSHDNTRLECNRCHTKEGLNNAPQRIWNFKK